MGSILNEGKLRQGETFQIHNSYDDITSFPDLSILLLLFRSFKKMIFATIINIWIGTIHEILELCQC